MYNENMYSEYQLQLAKNSIGTESDITDLDPTKYSATKMKLITICRSNNPSYGNIDDLPYEYSSSKMLVIALARGYIDAHGSVEDVKHLYCAKVLKLVSYARGCESCYGYLTLQQIASCTLAEMRAIVYKEKDSTDVKRVDYDRW